MFSVFSGVDNIWFQLFSEQGFETFHLSNTLMAQYRYCCNIILQFNNVGSSASNVNKDMYFQICLTIIKI